MRGLIVKNADRISDREKISEIENLFDGSEVVIFLQEESCCTDDSVSEMSKIVDSINISNIPKKFYLVKENYHYVDDIKNILEDNKVNNILIF